jgi:hypothetical protein
MVVILRILPLFNSSGQERTKAAQLSNAIKDERKGVSSVNVSGIS